MKTDEGALSLMKEILPKYSTDHFRTLIPKAMLGLSDEQMQTIEFAFWFCYVVERDLADVLQTAINLTREMLGNSDTETDRVLREQYGIKFEVADEEHPKYDANSIVFNDRIDIVEKIRGKDGHTEFFRKVKKIRNNLSHGRLMDLSYEGQSLFEATVKAKLLGDYIENMTTFSENGEGGAIENLTPKDKERINAIWEEFKRKRKLD